MLDPIFGPLNALVNVPKSHIVGFDVSATAVPFQGFTLRPMFAFTKTRIDGDFVNYDYSGKISNFTGYAFPFVPKVQANLDAEYRFALSPRTEMFLGGNFSYSSKTNSKLGDPPRFAMQARKLLDLRAGVDIGDMEISIWGRNVTNQFYVTNALRQNDADIRYVGAPVTYGLTFSYKMR